MIGAPPVAASCSPQFWPTQSRQLPVHGPTGCD